jgi:catechol 2,3-dioxygenase-like lactoylglutathione lyase family enzyme
MPGITGVSHIDLSVTDLDVSEEWYTKLLGANKVLDGRNDEHHFESRYLMDPESWFVLGLVRHDDLAEKSFDEHRVGLDHLSLNVVSREELDAWAAHLDELGIDYSPIVESDLWDVLVLRDPDNIQLELFYMKVDILALVP